MKKIVYDEPFEGWCSTGEDDQTVKYVEPLESLMYIAPTKGRQVFYNIGGLRMAYSEGIYNFRDTGKLAHKAYDLEKHAEEFMRSPEGYKLAVNYAELLSNAPDIDYIGIGRIPYSPDAIYGIAPLSKDSALLFGSIDSYKLIDRWARQEGINTDDFIRRAIGEEYFHLIRRGKATIKEEEEVREWLIGIYDELMEGALDSSAKEKYQRIINSLERDLATVAQRYSNYSKSCPNHSRSYPNHSNPDLESILSEDGVSECKSCNEEETGEYVSSKSGEETGASEVEHSGYGSGSEYDGCDGGVEGDEGGET